MKNILFRADSSSTIGTGHIMRDLVLASKYAKKGHKIIFATQNLQGNINHKIKEAGYKILNLNSNSPKELNKYVLKYKIDMIVIDHYDIDYKFERKLKEKNQKLKVLSFDDTYERHHCDILLNHNISADKKKYKDLVLSSCELRCGSKYTLLRDEFLEEKKRLKNQRKEKKKKFEVFVAMGGADHSNINIKILKVLKKIDNLKVNLVTTTANQNLQALEKYCKNKSWINLQINSNNIAKLISTSDFTIVTPSVIVNEVYFLEKPIIAIRTAENQMDMYKFLKKKKVLSLPSFKTKSFKSSLKTMQKDLKKL